MADWNDWNELVDASRRHESSAFNARPASLTKPTHIVIHITGGKTIGGVLDRFVTKHEASSHYLVDREGHIHQFVRDKGRAWHAGITSAHVNLYKKNDGTWRKYKHYFGWSAYPAGSKYYDANLAQVTDKSKASLVGTSDGSEWPDYAYFDERWGELKQPFYFDKNTDPNGYSIGIELLSEGATTANADQYPEALYQGLDKLLTNLCAKYDIPRDRQHIIGHEDVDPCARWGWDPNQGFDWDRVLKGGEDGEPEEDVDHGDPRHFELATMTEDHRYEHLKAVWARAQERFGHKGDAAYDFQEENGKINLIGVRGMLASTLQPVANTRNAWDDTMLVVFKDKEGKKRVEAFVISTEPNDPKNPAHSSTLKVGMHKYVLATHHKSAQRVRLKGLAAYPSGKCYRALNPASAVSTYIDANRNLTEDPGENDINDAAINIHYGGDGANSTWSWGCQVFKGWSNYVDFIRLVESDASIKGTIDNDLADKPASDGTRPVIYLLIESNHLRPSAIELPLHQQPAKAHYEVNEQGGGGYFPVGANNFWHGGVHFDGKAPVVAVADGVLVAYCASQDPIEVQLGGENMPLSRDFVLIHHEHVTPNGHKIQFFSLYMHLLPLGCYSDDQKAAPPAHYAKSAFVVAVQEDGRGLNVRDGATGKTVLGVIPKDAHFDVIPGSVATWNAAYKEVSYEGLSGFACVTRKYTEKVTGNTYRCITSEDKPADASKMGLNVRETGSGSRVLRVLPKGSTIEFKDPQEAAPNGKLSVGWHELADGGWVYVRAGKSPTVTCSYTVEPDVLDEVANVNLPVSAGTIVGYTGPYLVRERTVHFEIIVGDVEFLKNPKKDKGGTSTLEIASGTVFKKRSALDGETDSVDLSAKSRVSIADRYGAYRQVEWGKDPSKKKGWVHVDALDWKKDLEEYVLKTAISSVYKDPPKEIFEFSGDEGKAESVIFADVPPAGSPSYAWDKDGKAWYEIEFAPGKKGWIQSDGEGVQIKSAYDWPRWQKIEEDSDDGLCDAAVIVELIDKDGDKAFTSTELKQALEDPVVAAKLRRIICLHPTEWAGEIKGIDRLGKTPWNLPKSSLDTTKDYIEKLGFWCDVEDPDLPAKDKVWNPHPVGFIEQLRSFRTSPPTCSAQKVSVWKWWKLDFVLLKRIFSESPRQQNDSNVVQIVAVAAYKNTLGAVPGGWELSTKKWRERLQAWKDAANAKTKEDEDLPPTNSHADQNRQKEGKKGFFGNLKKKLKPKNATIKIIGSHAKGEVPVFAEFVSTVGCRRPGHVLKVIGPDGASKDLDPSGDSSVVLEFSGEDNWSNPTLAVPTRYEFVGTGCDGRSAVTTVEVYPASSCLVQIGADNVGSLDRFVDRFKKLLQKWGITVEVEAGWFGELSIFSGWREDEDSWRVFFATEFMGKVGAKFGVKVKFSALQFLAKGTIPQYVLDHFIDIGIEFEFQLSAAIEVDITSGTYVSGSDLYKIPDCGTKVNLVGVVEASFGLYALVNMVIFAVEAKGGVRARFELRAEYVVGSGVCLFARLPPVELEYTIVYQSMLGDSPKQGKVEIADKWESEKIPFFRN